MAEYTACGDIVTVLGGNLILISSFDKRKQRQIQVIYKSIPSFKNDITISDISRLKLFQFLQNRMYDNMFSLFSFFFSFLFCNYITTFPLLTIFQIYFSILGI